MRGIVNATIISMITHTELAKMQVQHRCYLMTVGIAVKPTISKSAARTNNPICTKSTADYSLPVNSKSYMALIHSFASIEFTARKAMTTPQTAMTIPKRSVQPLL
jgi:hypothetical protein